MIHGPYVPLSSSMPVHVPSDNQQNTEAAQDEWSFQQVIPNIPQQSLYPSLAAMGSSPNTAILPSIPLSRRVISDIEEHQRQVLDSYVEGMDRGRILCLSSLQMNNRMRPRLLQKDKSL